MLSSLVYVSRRMLASSPGNGDLEDIRIISLMRNSQKDLSGVLIATPRFFAQFLEGDAIDINDIMLSIAADPRHADLRIVDRERASVRAFPGWRMACFGPGTFVERHVEPLLQRQHDQPEADTAEPIVGLMHRLIADRVRSPGSDGEKL